jgi:hypothetical protein
MAPTYTGSCTASMPNTTHSEWIKANPQKNKSLCPHTKTVACSCRAFVSANHPKFLNKCTCNHDNKVHNK